MTHIENTDNWVANEGCFIIRKADGFTMGEDICLGSSDNIENYEDKPYTQEEYDAFYEKYGHDHRKINDAENGETNN